MPQALAIPLIMGGVSAVAGGLANRAKTVKTSSSTKRVLPGEFQGSQDFLQDRLRSNAQNPAAALDPLRLAARNSVNRDYAAAPQALRGKYMTTPGGGSSGKFGRAARMMEMSRMGGLADLEGKFAGMAVDREDRSLQMIQQMLQSVMGEETQGTQQIPGNVMGGALSSGLSAGTSMYAMDKMLGQGMNPFGGSGGGVLSTLMAGMGRV